MFLQEDYALGGLVKVWIDLKDFLGIEIMYILPLIAQFNLFLL